MTKPAAVALPVGTTVRWLRAKRGWTQQELARKAGLHRRTIQELESDETRRPRPITAVRLAAALDIPLGQLLGEETD